MKLYVGNFTNIKRSFHQHLSPTYIKIFVCTIIQLNQHSDNSTPTSLPPINGHACVTSNNGKSSIIDIAKCDKIMAEIIYLTIKVIVICFIGYIKNEIVDQYIRWFEFVAWDWSIDFDILLFVWWNVISQSIFVIEIYIFSSHLNFRIVTTVRKPTPSVIFIVIRWADELLARSKTACEIFILKIFSISNWLKTWM